MLRSTNEFFDMLHAAHVLGQAGAGRLLLREIVGRLLPVADRQRRRFRTDRRPS